jgi:hypothetical protein
MICTLYLTQSTQRYAEDIYEATDRCQELFKYTFVLTPAAPMNWFSCPVLFDVKLSCEHR